LEVIAGVDEAGRGPLAGPVVAAAVILSENKIDGLNDSKKLSEKKREILFDEISEKAESIGIGIVSEKLIDNLNILTATQKAMQIALGKLRQKPTLALVDGYELPNQIIRNKGIIKGDAKVEAIMAASIIAKVTRDNILKEYDKIFPEYGLAKHKGYGTKQHIEALNNYKASPIHRRSFKPVNQNLPTIKWLQENRRVGIIGEQLVACKLMNDGHRILKLNENCAPFGEIDENFDPKIHEAIASHKVSDKSKDNKIAIIIKKGYKFGEKLLRPAQVIVGMYNESDNNIEENNNNLEYSNDI